MFSNKIYRKVWEKYGHNICKNFDAFFGVILGHSYNRPNQASYEIC